MEKTLKHALKNTNHTIFGQVFVNVTLIIIIALLLLGAINYQYSRNILIKSIKDKNEIIYQEIKDILALQDASLDIIENNLDVRAQQFSRILLEYFKNTDGIENLDLDHIRQQIGMNPENEDIYVIDRNGIVVNTTFKKDLNLNFFSFGEEHKSYLINVFNQGSFVSERFTIESSTKRLRKYTYQPTKDGKYIIELGFYYQKADEIADFVKNMLNRLSDKNQTIVSVDLFIGEDAPFSLNKAEQKLDEETQQSIENVFASKSNVKMEESINGKPVHVEYIYMGRKNTDLYKNSVIRIITDRSDERKALLSLFFYSFIIFGITLLIVIFFIYKFNRFRRRIFHF